ncbi:unnamed protein product, partial [Symbiodinium necroappetens]
TGAVFLQTAASTPASTTPGDGTPWGLTPEMIRRGNARMEAESGRRHRAAPPGAEQRPTRPSSPPSRSTANLAAFMPGSVAATSVNTDEVLNEAAIRLAMSNQNNVFPPIRETQNAEEARRGRAERRGGERPATAEDPPPPVPVQDYPPLTASPVTWVPAPPVMGPLPPEVTMPAHTAGQTAPGQATSSTTTPPRTTTPRRRSVDRRRTPDRVASLSPGPTRRSGTVGIRSKLSDAEVAEIRRNLSPDYARYKDRMHRRGAAAEDDMPQSIRHLARPTVEDVIQMEESAAAGDQSAVPKIPPASAPTFCGYWFCRRLPEGYLGARIPWEAQKERRRVAGWCTHPCTADGCQYVAECRKLTSAGVGRCLRPVIIDNGAVGLVAEAGRRTPEPAAAQIHDDIAALQADADKALLRRRYPRRRRDAQADMALVPVTTTGGSTFGDFLKVVADAGGTAHLATFARLGVTNSPAVRESFPVLLDHGVPETVLLAILAPVPPQQPTPMLSQTRSDVPERRSSTRASMAAALEAMDPSRREETMAAIDSNLLAQSTRRSMESRVRMVTTLAEKGIPAVPPRRAEVEHRLRSPVSADLRRAARSITKAALRGLPGSRLKQAFDLADLATLVEHDVVDGSLDMDTLPHAVDVVVFSTWFMLREIEIAGARVKDVEITTATVSLDIPLHKTAQGGQLELTRRSFRCVCSTARQPLCPRCTADRHVRRLARSEPGAYLFPGAGGQQRTKLETAGLFNMVLSAAGLQTIYTDSAGHKRFVFGGHAARIAGATFLALRGVPVAIIQLIGRWSSTAVERYTQQAPLAVAPGIPAQALAAGGTQANAVLRPPPAALGQAHWAQAICDAPPEAQQNQTAGTGTLAAAGVPAVDFSAELPAIDFVPAPVSAERALIPAATATHYIVNCRTRLLHKPAAEEAETERAEWQARCGWPYGVRQFYRLHDLPPNPSMCRRCFPDTPVDLDAPEAVSSSGSSSSTSGATSDSD